MKRILHIFLLSFSVLMLVCCDNGYLASESVEELVVEGWIEAGHSPVVFVSSTLPVSSTPQPISNIQDHILRYAQVSIEHDGQLTWLTARLTDKNMVANYFTSSTLKGEVGGTYTLHVKWLDFEARAVCTIPEPVPIDEAFYSTEQNDSSYVAMIRFSNDPAAGRFYQSFMMVGSSGSAFRSVNFSTLSGAVQDTVITEKFMKTLSSTDLQPGEKIKDLYFHSGESVTIKLATMEEPVYEFWKSYANAYNSDGSVIGSPMNLKGNVDGAIGYWAGYGIDTCKIEFP